MCRLLLYQYALLSVPIRTTAVCCAWWEGGGRSDQGGGGGRLPPALRTRALSLCFDVYALLIAFAALMIVC